MPSLIVIAGPNGSGKSTLYQRLIRRIPSFRDIPFINPDEVAKDLFGAYLQEDSAEHRRQMLVAGKEALKQRKELLSQRYSFGFETTLSGNSEMRMIQEARNLGYSVTLIFVGLDDPALNVMRVKLRVQNGGHHVAPQDIVRRWERSMENLKKVFPLVKRLYLVDNSGEGHRLVASVTQKAFIKSLCLPKENTTTAAEWSTPLIKHFLSLNSVKRNYHC